MNESPQIKQVWSNGIQSIKLLSKIKNTWQWYNIKDKFFGTINESNLLKYYKLIK